MNFRLKPLILCFLAVCGGMLASCLVLELILMFTDQQTYNALMNDARTGLMIYKPNMRYHSSGICFKNYTSINRLGFHAKDIDPEKKPGTFRIVVMGSSFTEAFQVPLEKNFSSLLEAELNANPGKKYDYEVVPFGIAGNGTYLDMIYYEKYAKALKPDLVIDLTTEYELTRNQPTVTYPPRFDRQGQAILDLPANSQNTFVVRLKNFFRNSKLFMNLYFRYLALDSRFKNYLSHPTLFSRVQEPTTQGNTPAPDQTVLWETEKKLLSQFSSLVKRDNSRFLLVSWFNPQLDDTLKKNYLDEFEASANRNHFAYLDLAPSMEQAAQREAKSPIWVCDDHWNEFGHKWAATGIHDYLLSNPPLIQR